MKGILFSDSGDFFRCSFDGADRDGKPCITVITQGEVVQSLDNLSFHVIDMDTEDRLVDDVESDNLDDLFSYIHTFIHILVVEAEMCVDSLGLFANGAVLKEMDPDDFEIFDYINGQEVN